MSDVRIEFGDTPERLAKLAEVMWRYVEDEGWSSEPHHVEEIRTLPGEYAPPHGQTFVALDSADRPVGCVVLRPIPTWCEDCVEMRRLFVLPDARGRGIARLLIKASEAWAHDAGYARMRLVTLPHMTVAQGLYERLGFRLIEPYRPSTAEDAIFMDKPLG